MRDAAAAAWDALARSAWDEALTLAGHDDDDPEALEAAAVAHWWLDDADAALAAREAAFRLYRERGDRLAAGRTAGALASDTLLFGGRAAAARSWIDCAARLLAAVELSPEHGWLAVREAEVALTAGSPTAARAAAARAAWIATAVEHTELEVVARSHEGLALIHEGAVGEGMRRLHESAAAATAGVVADPIWIGAVCSNLIAACARTGDHERAARWSVGLRKLERGRRLKVLSNTWRTYYAGVLLQTGDWTKAEAGLDAAVAAFAGGRRTALAEATAMLGELRRRQGRLDEAAELFGQSERTWTARVGAVELALDEDDPPRAFALAEHLRRATVEDRRLDRAALLALVVRAAVAAGRDDAAGEAARELDRLAETVDTALARASAAYALGERAHARKELEPARRRFETAADVFAAPYERARAHTALARVLHELGLRTESREAAEAAHAAFARLGARRDAAAAARLLEGKARTASPAGLLTSREREVLAYVAVGHSNREIAERLVISEHTVHRHVSSILRKLGEPTRTAATARATRDGIV